MSLEVADKMEEDSGPPSTQKKFFVRAGEFIVLNFLRLTIAKKLMLGFSSLLALLIIISAYALTNLNRLNSINDSILRTDVPVLQASEKMIDLILAEELYTRRHLVFRTSDVYNIYVRKQEQFSQQLQRIESVPEDRNFPVAKIASLHQQYVDLLAEGSDSVVPPSSTIPEEYEEKIKAHQDEIIAVIKVMAADARRDQNKKTSVTADIGSIAFTAAAVLCAFGLVLSMTAAWIITGNIAGAIKKIKLATEKIAKGEFDYRPDISNKDELGDLAEAFVTMADRLKHLEEMNLDTSPLTRLPGGTTISNVMNKRIDAKAAIAFCLMDIDNFKAYNDHYGYAKGNDLIQGTADMISKAVAEHGGEDDFIGHIGGDDFVVITTPERCENICQAVVDTYDRQISYFYSAEDRLRGHITGESRQGHEVTYPLATISVAVVTNEHRAILNHIEFGEAAAEMKEKAKSESRSLFLVDKRKDRNGTAENRQTNG
jgi:diguanylate cyclase (GGDEF)-like protein